MVEEDAMWKNKRNLSKILHALFYQKAMIIFEVFVSLKQCENKFLPFLQASGVDYRHCQWVFTDFTGLYF